MTYTYAILEISVKAYNEIRAKLKAAGYDHAFEGPSVIDMHGIALKPIADVDYKSRAAGERDE